MKPKTNLNDILHMLGYDSMQQWVNNQDKRTRNLPWCAPYKFINDFGLPEFFYDEVEKSMKKCVFDENIKLCNA